MKSHVSIEQQVCPVCCTTFDTGAILLDKQLKESLERNTVTGCGLCPDCDKKREGGYVALVEVDEKLSTGSKPDGFTVLGVLYMLRSTILSLYRLCGLQLNS